MPGRIILVSALLLAGLVPAGALMFSAEARPLLPAIAADALAR